MISNLFWSVVLVIGFVISESASAGTRICTDESDARAHAASTDEPDAEDLAAQIQLLRAELREIKAILRSMSGSVPAPARSDKTPRARSSFIGD